MDARRVRVVVLLLFPVLSISALINAGQAQKSEKNFSPVIPRTWEEEAMASLELPLASTGVPPEHIPSDYYYRMPVRPIYKSYPIYPPGKEPRGYFEQLKQLEPEIVFDPARLKTEADWIKAGDLAFDAPIAYDSDGIALLKLSNMRNPAWYQKTSVALTKDGVMPYLRYVIRRKGIVEVGNFACAMCHTRVMADASVIKGAQGNFPFDRVLALGWRTAPEPEPQRLEPQRGAIQLFFGTPWLQPDPLARIGQMSFEEVTSAYEAIPPGVLARHGSSILQPVQVPDLIGIEDRRYLDRTGLVRHRDIGDLMRYGALNQDGDLLSRYGDFRPIELIFGKLPEPAMLGRYSDEQLYALARYIYSLEPPPNPNKFDALATRGKSIFETEGCAGCHTPPLYTNNKLTRVDGFDPPKDHFSKYDILQVSVGTDPKLALITRRGTGYYKVPSLKGVWYRGPFEHNGSVATLEDWFDPRRLRDDYVPTGFKGSGVQTRAVKGHEFGLKLSAENRRALIAFLRTL